MKTKLGRIVLLALLFNIPRVAVSAASSADEKAIRDLETQQQEAWNKHDAKAYAHLFTEDGDCVNVLGWWWKGRREIEQKLTAAYAFVFKESVLAITNVDVKFVTPDVAVAHVRWTMVGAKTPDGVPKPQQGIQTQTLHKNDGKWLIAAFQNTNGIPEFPFPQGPPTEKPGAARAVATP